jgi:hypothetical protein
LNYDGTVTDMKSQNTVGDLLGYVCQKAVRIPRRCAVAGGHAPDGRANYREITVHVLLLLSRWHAENLWTHSFTFCWD